MKVLDRAFYICYPVQFCKDKCKNVLAFLDFGSEINAITLAYTAYLGLKVKLTNVATQKIDGSLLVNYGMVIAAFQIVDKLGRSWFFQKIFFLADISMAVILGMAFITFDNAHV